MAKEVYANGREVSSKKSGVDAKSTPTDVCHTPPPPPPMAAAKIGIPIPYPNFGKQKTLAKGTKFTYIKGQPISRKNISYYKKSSGNEPATTQFKKGVVSSEIQGKTYAASYSMDIFFERKNAVRQGDISKHNAGKGEINTTPGKFGGGIARAATKEGREELCKEAEQENEKERERHKDESKVQEYNSDTVATFTDGENSKTAYSSSNKLVEADHLAQGVSKEERKSGINLCNQHYDFFEGKDPKKNYDLMKQGYACHCETKIIPEFMKAFGGPGLENRTLVGNIDWKQKVKTAEGKAKKALNRFKHPCPQCFRLLCDVQEDCKTHIYLCDNSGKPADLKKTCDEEKKLKGTEYEGDSYRELAKRLITE